MSKNIDTLIMLNKSRDIGHSTPEVEISQLSVDVVPDESIFSLLHDEWNDLVDAANVTVYQTFEWSFLWWKHFGVHPSRTLHLVLFRHKNRLVGIAPFFLETDAVLGITLYRRLRMMGCGVAHQGSGGMFTRYSLTDYLDIIAHPDYETVVACSLAAYLQKTLSQYDEIEFTEASQESFIVNQLVPAFEDETFQATMSRLEVCPRLHLPDNLDELIRGCSKRLRRYIPKARAMFPEETIENVQTPEDLATALRELIQLHQHRWNRIGFPGLFANKRYKAFQEELLSRFMDRGLLWCKRIRMEGCCIAANLGFQFKGRIYDYLSGFDADSPYAKHSPVLALLVSVIEDGMRAGIPVIDFLRGDEKYKLEMTSEAVQNWHITFPNASTQRTIRVRLSWLLRVWRSIIQRISKEALIVKVHHQEYGIFAFAFRYLTFRSKRVFGEGTKLSKLSAWIKKLDAMKTAATEKIQNLKSPLADKVRRSLERDSDMPLSRKLLKGWIYIRSMSLARLYLYKCNTVGARPRTRCRPYIDNAGRIVIGDDFNLNSRIVRSELATGHKGVLAIGNEVVINYGAAICAHEFVKIGDHVHLGPYVSIMDSDFHMVDDRAAKAETAPVVIEDGAWLGTRVIVLKGTTIGKSSVITAGSVVSGDIPAGVLAGGNPARIIRRLGEDKSAAKQMRADQSLRQAPEPADRLADRVTAVFSKVFTLNGPVQFSWGPKDIAQWDSLGHLNLMFGIESEFDITLSEEDLVSLNSVGEVYEIVRKYVEHAPAS